MKKWYQALGLLSLAVILSSCSVFAQQGWFSKSNLKPPAPLTPFTPKLHITRVWGTYTGSGIGHEAIKLTPAVGQGLAFSADYKGRVTAVRVENGNRVWSVKTKAPISSGPTYANGMIYMGTRDAHVLALNATDGSHAWETPVANQVLAAPTVSGRYVLIKTIDDHVVALDAKTGAKIWSYDQGSPTLILRGSSRVAVADNKVVAGFNDGRVVALSLDRGSIVWERVIAYPAGATEIEQMVDIDADLAIYNNVVYAASYQGNIASIELGNGQIGWRHQISSYTGLAIASGQLFVTDADSHVWSFDTITGGVDWRQSVLEYRYITAPAYVNGAVVVGDKFGYLHWLSRQGGQVIGRVNVTHDGFVAAPLVVGDDIYVVSRRGYLARYHVNA